MKPRPVLERGRSARLAAGLICLLGMAAALAVPVRADEVTFHDLTDTVTATVASTSSGSHVAIDLCGIFSIPFNGTSVSVEGCKATITGPAASRSFRAPLLTLIGGDNGNVSDAILVLSSLTNSNQLEVVFASDLGTPNEPGLGAPCSAFPGGCQATESGSVQTGLTITWSNGAKDKVHFASDAEGSGVVPEPASLLLLGSALLAFACLKRWLS